MTAEGVEVLAEAFLIQRVKEAVDVKASIMRIGDEVEVFMTLVLSLITLAEAVEEVFMTLETVVPAVEEVFMILETMMVVAVVDAGLVSMIQATVMLAVEEVFTMTPKIEAAVEEASTTLEIVARVVAQAFMILEMEIVAILVEEEVFTTLALTLIRLVVAEEVSTILVTVVLVVGEAFMILVTPVQAAVKHVVEAFMIPETIPKYQGEVFTTEELQPSGNPLLQQT